MAAVFAAMLLIAIIEAMDRNMRKIAESFKRLLEGRIGELEVIVFGSQARGEAVPGSDLDICIVVAKKSKALRNLILDCAWEVGFRHGIVIAPIIYSRREWAGIMSQSPIVRSIKLEGIKL